MSFSALLVALLLEYFRPLPPRFRVYSWFDAYAHFLERQFNAGEHHHGVLAWMIGAMIPAAMVAAAGYVLAELSPLLGWAWGAAVLYLSMGFRHSSTRAGNLAMLLRRQDLAEARMQLEQWLKLDAAPRSASEIARLGIEETLLGAYKQLFGVVVWFVVFGAGGAALYRLAQILARKWGSLDEREFGEFGFFAVRVLGWMEWVPLRLTGISFAVVGDFEDAMYCWRSQAGQWVQQSMGIILASGAGALGVKLGESRLEWGIGDEADADYLDSALSMVWRVLMLWLVLLLLLALARWTGS